MKRFASTGLGMMMVGLWLLGMIESPAEPNEEAAAVAKAGEISLSPAEIRQLIASLDAGQRQAVAKDPELLNQVVRSLLVQRLVVKQAQDAHWHERPEVQARIERAKLAALSESYLQAEAEKEMGDYPSASDVSEAYEKAKPKLVIPKQIQLAQIFISAPADASKESASRSKVKLDSILSMLKSKDADFAAIARLHSDEEETASRGGEIGWLNETQIQPELRPKIHELKRGAFSDPVRLADGWHILRIIDLKEERTPSLEEVQHSLIQQLRSERIKQVTQKILADLVKERPAVLNEIEISRLAAEKP